MPTVCSSNLVIDIIYPWDSQARRIVGWFSWEFKNSIKGSKFTPKYLGSYFYFVSKVTHRHHSFSICMWFLCVCVSLSLSFTVFVANSGGNLMLNLRATLKMETVASLGLGLLLIGISKFPRMKQHNFWGIGRVFGLVLDNLLKFDLNFSNNSLLLVWFFGIKCELTKQWNFW